MRPSPALLLLALAAACGRAGERPAGNAYTCGIAALAGPGAVLEAFTVAQQTLSQPPRGLPGRLPARIAAGPSLRAIVGQADTGLVVGIEGAIPPTITPAYGVLVVQRGGAPQGIMLFEGTPIEAAPSLGIVSVGERTLPLLGVELDLARVQDPSCPLFPDSLAS